MQLKFDWLIVLENLRRGIMVTDVTLEGPAGPRIIYVNHAWIKMTGYSRDDLRGKTPRLLQGEHTDHAVMGLLKEKLLNREVFHGQTWNYRKGGEPFLMNWYCYSIFGERGKPIYYVAEQDDVTEIESLRLKQRLLVNPQDVEALKFFDILESYRAKQKRIMSGRAVLSVQQNRDQKTQPGGAGTKRQMQCGRGWGKARA